MTEVEKLNRALTRTTEQVVKTLTVESYRQLVDATRKDTGYSASGWTPSLGRSEVPSGERPSGTDAALAGASIRFARNRGRTTAIATTYSLRSGSVFISNNIFFSDKTTERALRIAIEASKKSLAGRFSQT